MSTLLEPKGIDQSGERGGLLTPTGVVKEESGKRLAPVLQHANELAPCEVRCNFILSHESEAYAINGGPDNDLHIVNDKRSVHGDRQGLPALLEFPSIDLATMPVAEIDASMAEQVARSFRLRVLLEIAGEPTMAARRSLDTRTAIMSF
jgi:hypothetical protein